MDKKTVRVFNGWLELNSYQRTELEIAMKDYQEAPEDRRRRLHESTRDSVFKVETGPLGSSCPCCGR